MVRCDQQRDEEWPDDTGGYTGEDEGDCRPEDGRRVVLLRYRKPTFIVLRFVLTIRRPAGDRNLAGPIDRA